MSSRAQTPGVDSARRVLQVLLMFSENRPALTVEQIVNETQISTPSVYRYLALLKELALVEERAYSTYSLSPRALALGRAAEQAFPLTRVLHAALERLSQESGETAQIMRRVDDSVVCSDSVEVSHAVRLSFTPGLVMPLHRGAAAKILLSGRPNHWIQAYLERASPRLTGAQKAALLVEVERIRENGWAHSSAEVDEGIWAVAAPIMSDATMVAAVCVAGPRYRISDEKAKRMHHEVIAVAREISASLSSA